MPAGPRLRFELFRAERMTLPELREALAARAKDIRAMGRKYTTPDQEERHEA